MTRKEVTGKRDLTFSCWIRENLPDSSTGFLVSDLDFILQNYRTKKIMLLEIKTRNSIIKTWQRRMFMTLDDFIRKGICDGWYYLGFNIITFQNTNFYDGKVYLNKFPVTENKLKSFLSF